MTLLSICQDTADMVGLTRPVAIVASTDPLARQMLAAAKKTLEELGMMAWPILEIPYSFPTVALQAAYSLPADFDCEVGDTVYGSARYSEIRGSLTAGDWARQRNILPGLGFYRFRIYGTPLKLNLTPTPQGVETIVLEYKTSNRVTSNAGAAKVTFTADDDVSVFADTLMKKGIEWRVRRAKGMDYSEEFDDYEMSRAQKLAQAMQFGSMAVAYRGVEDASELIGMGYVPETGYGV